MSPIVQVDHVSVTFTTRRRGRKETKVAVQDASLAVGRGESLGIVGESGSGKTTLARCIVGLLRPSAGQVNIASGQNRQRGGVGMVFQDPYSSLNPRQRVGDAIAEPLRVHKLVETKQQARHRVYDLLELVGFEPEVYSRLPFEFSGGQRQRLAIARALAAEPDVLVCDEPTSALDVSVQAQVLRLLRTLQLEHELTIIMISHDLGVISYACDQVVVMQEGVVVENASTADLLAKPAHSYTRTLLASYPSLDTPRAFDASEDSV